MAYKIKSKINKLSPVYLRNLGTMKLLVSDTDFKRSVAEIRRTLKMPEKGFIMGSKEHQEWQKSILIGKSDRILNDGKTIWQEKHNRELLKSNEISRSQADKHFDLLYKKTPINFLNNEVAYITNKFYLPINFSDFIRKYILFNKTDAPTHNYVITLGHVRNFSQPIREVRCVVYTKLKKDEKKELMREIERFGDLLPTYKPLKNINRDLEIEELHQNKIRKDPVEMKDYTITNNEIAENILGDKTKGKKAFDSVRSLAKARKIRFHRSEKSVS